MPNLTSIKPADLLLINASNLPYEPFYPYAFVMISALARQAGISVKRLELSNLSADDMDLWLQTTIAACRPRMIGFTVRQTDTYAIQDYMDDTFAPYYPVDHLKGVIAKVKNLTSAPLILGGYGFSLHAKEILAYLDVSAGVKGCADPLFTHFEDILSGRNLDKIPNLVYRKNGRYHENQQIYFNPFSQREYNEEILTEILNHYGRIISYGRNYITLFNNGTPIALGNDGHPRNMYAMLSQSPSIPIEASRGCGFNCYFCSEPRIKGNKVRYRDLDVIEDEVRFCASKNLREFWFVCSELNPGQSDFALALAERMHKINETLGSHPLTWKAYHLPHFLSRPDLTAMYDSGFVTTWNDVVSLDDRQLEKARVPYRAAHALRFFEDDFSVRKEKDLLPPIKFSLFLGDVFLTPRSLTQTLQTFHRQGLMEKCGGAAGIYGIRIFDWEKNRICPDGAVTFSPGEKSEDLIHPTFQVAPALLKTFGHMNRVVEFFDYIINTLLSNNFTRTLDWSFFLARNTTPENMAGFMEKQAIQDSDDPLETIFESAEPPVKKLLGSILANPEPQALQPLFYPSPGEKRVCQGAAGLLVICLRAIHRARIKPLLAFLDLPPLDRDLNINAPSYHLLSRLYRSWDTEAELLESACRRLDLNPAGPEILILKSIFFQHNLILKKSYKEWICRESDE
ncbi:MAG: hypothetical protein GY737_20100 [Desulfobacteraceae bacterium]|nr:hypothetical protein [Desulfobacteraceae bacterium]